MRKSLGLNDAMSLDLGDYQDCVESALANLNDMNAASRLWARDGTFWTSNAGIASQIKNRLGWLDLPDDMPIEIPRLKALEIEIQEAGIDHIVLLGMGGSSLAAEMLRCTLGIAPNHPELTILDSTDPAQIRHVYDSLSMPHTIFLVASAKPANPFVRTTWARKLVNSPSRASG